MLRIDAHCHVRGNRRRAGDVFIASGIGGLVNINYAEDGLLASLDADQVALTDRAELPAHVQSWSVVGFPAVDYFRWSATQRDRYRDRLDAQLRKGGVIGIKLWKDLGMSAMDTDSRYVLPDDPRLRPLLELVAARNALVYLHTGDPIAAWLPAAQRCPDASRYYAGNPLFDMQLHPAAPTHGQLIASRARLVEAWPHVRFVICHLGDFVGGLKDLQAFLATHPNAWFDTAGRLASLERVETDDCRRFFVENAGRSIFGTDWTPRELHGGALDDAIDRYRRWTEFFERRLRLPVATVRALYAETFLRLAEGRLF